MTTIGEPARETRVLAETQVLVVGGGGAGVAAAVAGAREGADTMLVERYGQLGGLATGGLIILLLTLDDGDGRQVVAGLCQELTDRLTKRGAAVAPPRSEWNSPDAALVERYRRWGLVWGHGPHRVRYSVAYDAEAAKLAFLEMATDAKVRLLLHAFAADPLLEGGRVRGVAFESKSGRFAVRAEAVIDARVTRLGDDALFLRRLHELCAPWHAKEGYRIEIGGGFNRGPKVETPAEAALFAEWRRGARECGLDFDWQHVGGGSDGNILSAAGLPNLDGLGCVGDHLHSPEEFCHLPSLTQRAQVAALFLHRVAAGEVALPAR